MAKKEQKKETANVPAISGSTAIAPLEFFEEDSGLGFETMTPDDIAIPFLSILQSGSPQVKRGDSKIEDACEGDIFNTVTQKVYRELTVIPCAYQKLYVEWKPRESGGGFAGTHLDSEILKQTKKDDMGKDVLPNGNIIVTTAQHYVLVVDGDSIERAVMSLSSTQLKKSRRWNAQCASLRVKMESGKFVTPPIYSHLYKVSTVSEDNEKGQWMGWDIKIEKMITDGELYSIAREFYRAINSGKVKVTTPQVDTEETEVTDSEVF